MGSSFFCFKQKTAYEVRISDWSSDVCSSDLKHRVGPVSLVEIVRRSGYRAIMTDSKDASQSGYTYAKAGVSIAAGNALVKAIAPLARPTDRPAANAALGGFGAFFDPLRSEERRVGKEWVRSW